MVILGSLESAM